MRREISGRRVVITGASRGLGRQLAVLLAEQGARLGLLARDEIALKQLASTLDGEAVAIRCDVADPRSIAAAFDIIGERLGGIDSVIANAGVAASAHRAHNLSLADWNRTLQVNLTGTFLTAQAAHCHLMASGHGRLVLTSSVMARVPRCGLSAYATSKAGIEGLARALAVDWARDGITVNAIAPGFVAAGLGTDFADSGRLERQVLGRTPAGRFGSVEDLAAAVAFLASDAGGFVTGQVLGVDGGYGLG